MTRVLAVVIFLLVSFGGQGWAGPITGPEWEQVSSSGITVVFRQDFQPLAEQILGKAVQFLDESSSFLGLEAATGYSIIVAGSREEFAALQPPRGMAPEWAGALTYPDIGTVLIMSQGAMRTRETVYWSILRHEMVHLVLGEAQSRSGTRFPTWFEEGVATYMSGEMNLARLLHLGWAQVTGTAPSFTDLERNFPGKPGLAEAAYARSFLFIRYLTRRFGDGAVARLIQASTASGDLEKGAKVAFGVSLAHILEGFNQYARVKATWIPVIASSASIWGGITLLFLLTWYRKRVLGLRTLDQWEREEEMEDYETASEKRDEDLHTLH